MLLIFNLDQQAKIEPVKPINTSEHGKYLLIKVLEQGYKKQGFKNPSSRICCGRNCLCPFICCPI